MLKCTDTNNADALLTCFLEAANTYGLPSRVRTDQGLEKVKMAHYMISRRGVNRGSAITGKSNHHQRIEPSRRMSVKECQLDPLNDLHVVALQHVFLHKIQEKLDMWNKAWSQHRLRTASSSPIQNVGGWVAGWSTANSHGD